jgi:DNA polymerase III delta prime subunit
MKPYRFWEEATVLQWMYKNSPASVLHRLDQDIYEEIKDARDRLSVLSQVSAGSQDEITLVKDEIQLLLVYKTNVRAILGSREMITAKKMILDCRGQNVTVPESYRLMMLQWYQRRERITGCCCATGVSVLRPRGDKSDS